MIVEIDQRSDVPIYEQLHRQLIAAIAGDELSPGDSLRPGRGSMGYRPA